MNEHRATTDPDGQSVSSSAQQRGLILCPLRFEYRFLRASAELTRSCKIVCCGRGVDAVLNTLLEFEGTQAPTFSFIVMAGLAGSLHQSLTVGDVRCARRIVTDDGESWMTTWPTTRRQSAGIGHADFLTTRRVLRLPDEKHDANRTTSCTMVETESAALAAWASDQKIRWGVVRGVGDGVTDRMPDGIDEWTDHHGTTRLVRVACDLIRQPGEVKHLLKLKRNSTIAMMSVRTALEAMIAGGAND